MPVCNEKHAIILVLHLYEALHCTEIISQVFDMRPAKIISKLGLRNPIYFQTAAYGHFGRPDLDLPWEKLDMVEELKSYK